MAKLQSELQISLYRDPERRNSTIGSGGKPSSRHNRCKYGGCIPAIWEFDATLAHLPAEDRRETDADRHHYGMSIMVPITSDYC